MKKLKAIIEYMEKHHPDVLLKDDLYAEHDLLALCDTPDGADIEALEKLGVYEDEDEGYLYIFT